MRREVAALLLALAGCEKAAPDTPPPPAPPPSRDAAVPVTPAPEPPSDALCLRSLEHLTELEILAAAGPNPTPAMRADLERQKAAVMSAQHDEYLAACRKTPLATVECTVAAPTVEAAARCDSP